MSEHAAITVTVCTSCPMGLAGFADTLRDRLAADHKDVVVATRDCMSGCTRPSTVAVRSAGKTAYLFGDLTDADADLIDTFLRHYRDSDTGDFEDARVLGDLRFKAIARIPGQVV